MYRSLMSAGFTTLSALQYGYIVSVFVDGRQGKTHGGRVHFVAALRTPRPAAAHMTCCVYVSCRHDCIHGGQCNHEGKPPRRYMAPRNRMPVTAGYHCQQQPASDTGDEPSDPIRRAEGILLMHGAQILWHSLLLEDRLQTCCDREC